MQEIQQAVPPQPPESIVDWRKTRRQRLLNERMRISARRRAAWSGRIELHLGKLLKSLKPRLVGFCWPIRGEFDARQLLAAARTHGLVSALPVVQGPGKPLLFKAWAPSDKLKRGVLGIPYPVGGEAVVADLLLIPLLGFDEQGYRLGYGGGYFDITLASLQPRPVTVGVGYEIGKIATVWPQMHDIPMDYVVTERGMSVHTGTG